MSHPADDGRKDYASSSSSLYSQSEDHPSGSASETEVAKYEIEADAGKGESRRDALGLLLRLAEALEVDEGTPEEDLKDDFYATEEDSIEDAKLLGKKQIYQDDDVYDEHIAAKGYVKRHLPKSLDDSDDEDDATAPREYCAAPFNVPDAALPRLRPAEFDPATGEEVVRRFKRKCRVNLLGLTSFVIFCVAFCFYMYIRVTKTMDLGNYFWYGVAVLAVEVMGATTTLLYGINLLLDPVHEKPAEDEDTPGLPKLSQGYHVRVLVPVYKESLEIVSRTIKAAHEALLPEGCLRTLYLCDDGKDPNKRKWVASQSEDIVYVSGRKRAAGEINGKSGNLNNCLRQIYPDDAVVPSYEVVCVFDADQVANRDFFLKMLPLMDGGDDVGMVLSPQCFHNLRIHADIFNHANIHFWEYAQHGYDAFGFISCTGTNFLTRANCFKECGWSPEYTLTEDFALGMELMKRKWHCRYIEEYLAIGEAPDQVRNCFQQRSRWCKGHFQVVLSRKHCPLFQKGLSSFMRLMYCSGVWSYVVGAVTTPMFIVIPLLTIWAGIFPIVISQWAALALSVYYLAQSLILNYVRKFKHVESLWFANVCNNILWFTYVKALWRALGSVLGSRITFKTTLKGAGRLMDSAVGDLWMPLTVFLALAISLGVGLQKLISGPTIITTLAISCVWIVYAMVPPYLLLHYTFVGRGSTLQFMSRIAFLLSWAASICAILLLWAVYPRSYDMGTLTTDSLLFFETQRLGVLPADNRIPWRQNALTTEPGPAGWPSDLSGGWMGGGLLGDVQMTMPIAFATSTLAWSLLAFPQGYAAAGQTGWAQSTVQWGADYLLKMVSPVQKANYTDYYIIYQVGNLSLEYNWWGRPEDNYWPRPAYEVVASKGASDISGSLIGAYVSTALVFQGSNATYYNKLMSSATALYTAAKTWPGIGTRALSYNCISRFAKENIGGNIPSQDCAPPYAALNGSAVAYYNSTTYLDDMLWAAAWLYKATGNSAYLADVNTYYGAYQTLDGTQDAQLTFSWDNMFWPSAVLLADVTGFGAFHTDSQSFLKQWVCGTNGLIKYTPKGRAYNPYAPSLGDTAAASFLSVLYGSLGNASAEMTAAQAQRYTCWGLGQVRYMLGDAGHSYVVGYGKGYPQQPQDRASSCPTIPANCTSAALNSTAPNPHVLTGALVQMGEFSDDFLDVRDTNATRVSIEYNAVLAGVSAGLWKAGDSWAQCLQGFGVFTGDSEVCGSS